MTEQSRARRLTIVMSVSVSMLMLVADGAQAGDVNSANLDSGGDRDANRTRVLEDGQSTARPAAATPREQDDLSRDPSRAVKIILGSLVESAEGRKYNTAFAIDGEGTFRGKYRKVHVNFGEQTWWGWSQGARFELIELAGVRYGVSICADIWFPETVRCEELLGADVILHQSIGDDMGHIVPTRAYDSKLPIVMAIFQGGSYAVDAEGKLLAKLSSAEPGWKTFTLFPFRRPLGRKYGGVWDTKKGEHNLRNVWAYSVLTDPSSRPPWTDIFMDDEGRPQTREQLLERFGGRYDAHDPATGVPASSSAAGR